MVSYCTVHGRCPPEKEHMYAVFYCTTTFINRKTIHKERYCNDGDINY